jgi:hypothetical protein
MRMSFRAALAVAALGLLGTAPALAGSTGLESIHVLQREGGRLCMADHFHYGAGHSDRSREAAQQQATRNWSSFVQLEYGSDWSSFGRAGSRDVSCSGASGNYSCTVSARPCRGGAVASTTASKKRSYRHSHRRSHRH